MRTLSVFAAALVMAMVLEAGTSEAQTGAAASARPGPFSVSAETIIWWFKSSPTPVPIVTDDVLGQPGTKVLLGGDDLDTNPNPGFRLTAGYALNERWGLEGNFLYIPSRSTSNSVSSSGQLGSTDLLLPFFDVTQNQENITELSFSPVYRGSAREELTNSLMGAEANGTWALAAGRPFQVDLLGGFRWLRLHETYTITTSSPFIPPQPVDIWNTTDEFDTFNNFYGAQLGVRARYDWGRFFASGSLKFAMGAMVQTVDINGSLVTNDFTGFGATQTFPGGYFALPTNIGSYTRSVFAVVPEVGLNIGYQITTWASVFVGYTFLYTNNVVRPGNQINRNINPTQSVSYVGEPPATLQGPAQPSFKFNSSDFWAQGLNVGLTFRF
ncbi:MAG: BBP7 family outer membrane beta-barrel protein [Candidatus Rokuibacteriota bacterium]